MRRNVVFLRLWNRFRRREDDECDACDIRVDGEDERGQSMVEYAFILVLISVAVITIVIVIGHQANNLYSNIESGMTYATG